MKRQRVRQEQTPLELLRVGKRFVAKAATRLEMTDTTRMRLDDIASELAVIVGALERRGAT